MKNENIFYFNSILSEVDWTYMYNSLHNVDDKITFYMSKLLHITSMAFPRKNVAVKLSRPKPEKVHSYEIDLCKEECSFFYDYYVSTGSQVIKKLYKNCKKKLSRLVKETRTKMNDEKINNSSISLKPCGIL